MHALRHFIQSLLQEEKLSIADVGASGGAELRWRPWEKLCFFSTFDPDPRSTPWSSPSKNYPIGLWSYRCTQALHLASYPPASSLFKPNVELTSAFNTHGAMQQVGTRKIELDTMDRILGGQGVDFIKIDAEGAELEILKGAQKTLSSDCLGVQLEAFFCQLRHNAPTFSDLDVFIRLFDFELFQIQREHWLRKNNISTFGSTPQLIWGNVLYLLCKKAFLKKLKESPNPSHLFAKYILILFAYNLYDYAYEVCDAVPLEEAGELKRLLAQLPSPKKEALPLILSLLVGGGKYLCAFSKKSKKERLNYLHRKIRQLGTLCLYLGKNDYALYD
jgi:hypothetical protein